MISEFEYTSKLTYDDYNTDKKNFFGQDARYVEDTDMQGETPEYVIYKKKITFCTEDEKIWGTWHETHTVRREPIFKILSTHRMGDNVFEQTVEQIGETVYEDLEYFAYGEGFKHNCASQFVHTVIKKMFKEVA